MRVSILMRCFAHQALRIPHPLLVVPDSREHGNTGSGLSESGEVPIPRIRSISGELGGVGTVFEVFSRGSKPPWVSGIAQWLHGPFYLNFRCGIPARFRFHWSGS